MPRLCTALSAFLGRPSADTQNTYIGKDTVKQIPWHADSFLLIILSFAQKSIKLCILPLKLDNPYYNNGVATCVSLSSIHIFPSLRHSCSIITNVVHILWSTNQCDKNENLHWHCQRHVSHWVNYSFLCNQSTLIRDLSEFIIICLDRNLSEENLLSILSPYLLLNTQYMRNPDLVYVLKMEYVSKINIFGLKWWWKVV